MVWGILGDDAMFVVELDVFETKLHSVSVGYCICVFTRAHAEEEYNLDEISLTFFKWGGVCSYSSLDDKPNGGWLFMFGWGGLGRSSAVGDEVGCQDPWRRSLWAYGGRGDIPGGGYR